MFNKNFYFVVLVSVCHPINGIFCLELAYEGNWRKFMSKENVSHLPAYISLLVAGRDVECRFSKFLYFKAKL